MAKTRWPILPFENGTQIEIRTVWFSDVVKNIFSFITQHS
jgi:hypothetical protein